MTPAIAAKDAARSNLYDDRRDGDARHLGTLRVILDP